jgi:hypothetical protein
MLTQNSNTDTKFIFNHLGEAGMGGAKKFGLIIKTTKGSIDVFEKEIIFVGSDESELKKKIFKDESDNFYIIEGTFFTYIFNPESEEFSIYKATLRGEDGIWCEENPILGKKVYHINSHKQHFYIQFPFIRHSEFAVVWHKYEQKRLEQISQFKNDSDK